MSIEFEPVLGSRTSQLKGEVSKQKLHLAFYDLNMVNT